MWAADKFNEMSGYAFANACRHDINHGLAMLGAECTYRLLLTPCLRSSVAAAIADKAPPTRDRYNSPAALMRTPCALRSNRRTPKCDSSRATWWLIADAVR